MADEIKILSSPKDFDPPPPPVEEPPKQWPFDQVRYGLSQ
jgi:hypothetical protein